MRSFYFFNRLTTAVDSTRSVWTMPSGTCCDSWSCPVQSQKLDSMMLVGPFQIRIFHDSMTTRIDNPECIGKSE